MREHIKHNVNKMTMHSVKWKIKASDPEDTKPVKVVESKWYFGQKSNKFPTIGGMSFTDDTTKVEIKGGSHGCSCPLVNEIKDAEGRTYKMEYLVDTFKDSVVVADQPQTFSATVVK